LAGACQHRAYHELYDVEPSEVQGFLERLTMTKPSKAPSPEDALEELFDSDAWAEGLVESAGSREGHLRLAAGWWVSDRGGGIAQRSIANDCTRAILWGGLFHWAPGSASPVDGDWWQLIKYNLKSPKSCSRPALTRLAFFFARILGVLNGPIDDLPAICLAGALARMLPGPDPT
jgi:hypothetical protein